MRVWVVSVGEPLPFDEGHPRLLRAGILARMMAARGHDVTWWSSTVIHMQKTLRFNETTVVPQGPNLNIVCLHGGLYTKNYFHRAHCKSGTPCLRILRQGQDHAQAGCHFLCHADD